VGGCEGKEQYLIEPVVPVPAASGFIGGASRHTDRFILFIVSMVQCSMHRAGYHQNYDAAATVPAQSQNIHNNDAAPLFGV
jgi:hypothetical protein